MKQKEVYSALARKLSIDKNKLNNERLSAGKIYIGYFKQLFGELNRAVLEDKSNIKPNEEFSVISNAPWSYLNPDAALLDFAHLLAIPSGKSSAAVRARCTRPRISQQMLLEFLSAQTEKPVSDIDLDAKVSQIRLPVAANERHSWITFIKWGESFGFKGHPEDLDEVAELSIHQLFELWAR